MAACPWCTDPNAEENSDALCLTHEAEYEGLTVDQLIQRDHIEFLEAHGI